MNVSFEGKRVALVLSLKGRRVFIQGVAEHQEDPDMGAVVAIRIDREKPPNPGGQPVIFVRRELFVAQAVQDTEHSCDYRLDLVRADFDGDTGAEVG